MSVVVWGTFCNPVPNFGFSFYCQGSAACSVFEKFPAVTCQNQTTKLYCTNGYTCGGANFTNDIYIEFPPNDRNVTSYDTITRSAYNFKQTLLIQSSSGSNTARRGLEGEVENNVGRRGNTAPASQQVYNGFLNVFGQASNPGQSLVSSLVTALFNIGSSGGLPTKATLQSDISNSISSAVKSATDTILPLVQKCQEENAMMASLGPLNTNFFAGVTGSIIQNTFPTWLLTMSMGHVIANIALVTDVDVANSLLGLPSGAGCSSSTSKGSTSTSTKTASIMTQNSSPSTVHVSSSKVSSSPTSHSSSVLTHSSSASTSSSTTASTGKSTSSTAHSTTTPKSSSSSHSASLSRTISTTNGIKSTTTTITSHTPSTTSKLSTSQTTSTKLSSTSATRSTSKTVSSASSVPSVITLSDCIDFDGHLSGRNLLFVSNLNTTNSTAYFYGTTDSNGNVLSITDKLFVSKSGLVANLDESNSTQITIMYPNGTYIKIPSKSSVAPIYYGNCSAPVKTRRTSSPFEYLPDISKRSSSAGAASIFVTVTDTCGNAVTGLSLSTTCGESYGSGGPNANLPSGMDLFSTSNPSLNEVQSGSYSAACGYNTVSTMETSCENYFSNRDTNFNLACIGEGVAFGALGVFCFAATPATLGLAAVLCSGSAMLAASTVMTLGCSVYGIATTYEPMKVCNFQSDIYSGISLSASVNGIPGIGSISFPPTPIDNSPSLFSTSVHVPASTPCPATYVSVTGSCTTSSGGLGTSVYCCSGMCLDGTHIGDPGQCVNWLDLCGDLQGGAPSCGANQVLSYGDPPTVNSGDGCCGACCCECQYQRNNWSWNCCDCPAGYQAVSKGACDGKSSQCVGCSDPSLKLVQAADGSYGCVA